MPAEQDDPRKALHERLHDAQRRRTDARAADDKAAWIVAAYDCARAHFELGETDLPFAQRLFGEARRLVEETGIHRELLPEILGMTGRTLQRMKRWDEVLPWYRRAAAAAAAQGLAAQQLRWLGKEATTCLDMKDERGRELLEKAIETGRAMLAAGQPVAEALADQLQHLANLETTETERSDALWEETERLLATLPQGGAHFRAAVNRGVSYANRDQPLVAQTYLEEAIEIGAAVGIDETERLQLVLRLAGLLRKRNEPVQAGERVLAFLPQCSDDRTRHELLTDAVDLFFAGNAWDRMKLACEQLRELRLRRDMAPSWQYDVEMRCAIACRGLEQFDESLERLRTALEYAQQWGNPEGITSARGQTAIVLLDKGDFAESVRIGEELWAAGVRKPLAARTLVRALIGKGDLDRAEAVAAEFEQADGDQLEAARLRAHLADVGRGDPRAAWSVVGGAAGGPPSVAEALTHLMALTPSGSKDRFEQARHRLRLMDYARMRVNDVFSDTSWRAAIATADEFPGWLDDFVSEALAGDQDEAAIFELERFRAQTLVNVLAEREALWSRSDVRRGWLKGTITSRLQRERYHFEALTARGASWRERRAVAREVQRLDAMALSAEGMVHIAPADQGLHFPQDLPDLLGEHRLAQAECLLFAHGLPDRLVVWARHAGGRIDRTTLVAFGRSVVDRMGHALRTIGYTDAPPDVDVLLGELDALCGKPLAAWLTQLGVQRAFLSAGTSLAALPLDCCAALLEPGAPELIMLPTGAALGFTRGVRKPLLETLPLLTQAERDRFAIERMQAARGHVMVVVDPSRDLDFAPLEGAMVAAGQRTRQLEILDQDRLDARALAGACGQVEILHVIGHGRFDEASPYRSGIAIGPLDATDTLWSNADIFSDVEAPAGRLAVLSGCETGQTRPNLVSEEVSLPAAFIAAGYAAVIASRWAVDDLSATLLMAEFHRRWNGGGTSVAAALTASRCWLRDMRRDAARTLVAGLADIAAGALPARADDCRQLCAGALELLEQESERPFANPLCWAAFFVAGDGAITSDGVDPRVPGRRRRPGKKRKPQ